MKQIQVHAQSRTAKGKAASGRLRRSGFFPAVLYSEGKPGRDIQLNEHDFVLLFRGHHAENLLMDLTVDSDKPVKALLKAMQHHPLNGRVLHADFYAISMDKKLELEIPVTLVGEARGVAQEGGILEHVLRSVMVECLPDDLPEELQLDVSDLGMGHTLKVKDTLKIRFTAATAEVCDTLITLEPLNAPDTVVIRNTAFAVKTNLLYDLVTALNVDVEFPVADRYSILVEDVFPWWTTGNKYAEARFWFKPWEERGTQKLRGWFVGAYGMSARYDFQYDTAINYQGKYWSAGVSGGYSAPIGRKKKLRLEISTAVGFMQIDYRHYQPTDDYLKLIRDPYNVGTVSYFGPTKLKVSLVIPINFSKKEVSND